jgi:hypothetical protein
MLQLFLWLIFVILYLIVVLYILSYHQFVMDVHESTTNVVPEVVPWKAGDWFLEGSVSRSVQWFRPFTGQPCHAALIVEDENHQLFVLEAKHVHESEKKFLFFSQQQLKKQFHLHYQILYTPLTVKLQQWKSNHTFVHVYQFEEYSSWSGFCSKGHWKPSLIEFWKQEQQLSSAFHCGVWIWFLFQKVYQTSTKQLQRKHTDWFFAHPYRIEESMRIFEPTVKKTKFLF